MNKEAKPDNELLECFDEDGRSVHPRPRSEVCTEGSRRWHGVANVWLVNPDGMLLCTQRANFVSGNPNKWQTYQGGHVKAGQTYLQTAVRELYEELGLKAAPDAFHLVSKGKYEPWMHFYESYAVIYDGGLKGLRFLDGEVVEAKWYAFEAYRKDRNKNPDKWCNGISEEDEGKIKAWLNLPA